MNQILTVIQRIIHRQMSNSPTHFYKIMCLLQEKSKDTELPRKAKRQVLALFPSHSLLKKN